MTFYFIWKALFGLRIYKVFFWVFCSCRKMAWSERLISKCITWKNKFRNWKNIITIHILSCISESKDNQKLKYSHLIECNKRNILLAIFVKCIEETSKRLFSKKLKLSISMDQQSEILYSLLSKWRTTKFY